MPKQTWQSLTVAFFDQAKTLTHKPLVFSKQDDHWQGLTWEETAKRVAKLASALQTLGVEAGDRVVIVSENRPEFLISDMAIMACGAISVPTYTTNTAQDHLHILEDSEAKTAIVSTKNLAHTFLKAAHQSDDMMDVILMEPYNLAQGINATLHDWASVLAAETADIEKFHQAAKAHTKDALACLIYTSGTGGAPKGVMLHHGAILHNCEGASDVIAPLGLKNNRFLSFLPLSHAYEHTAGQCLPIILGAEIWYAESLDKLAGNLAEVKPTIMIVVPRLFEMLRTRISRQIQKEGGLKAKLFERAIELGTKQQKGKEKLSIREKLENTFLSLTVRRQINKKFGGRMRALVSGGAPLSPDVGYFFSGLGLRLLQGYGQTEAAPVISVNPAHAPRMHTVGKALKGVEIKIAPDGEILARGELVMKGYWGNEKATEKAIIDGWLHTGDIGILDSDGYLEITDRKKDLIVNDKGDNVSPQRIEGMLALEEEIAQGMVYGDRRPYLVGLIVPDPEWTRNWAKENGKPNDLNVLSEDRDYIKALDAAVSRVNHRLSNLEKVRRFKLVTEPFTIENEQMTPTLKLRRHVVNEVYEELLTGMY